MTRGAAATLGAAVLAAACLGDPAGPAGRIVVQSLTASTDSVLTGSPGEPLPTPLRFRATDQSGRPLAGAQVEWTVRGTNGHVTASAAVTGADGTFAATWLLGTNAADSQALVATVRTAHASGAASLNAKAIPSRVARLTVAVDTLTARLGDTIPVPVIATDPYGNQFAPSGDSVAVLDSTIAAVDAAGLVTTRARGYTTVLADVQGVVDSAVLHVVQDVQAIVPSVDSVSFIALGDSVMVTVTLLDDKGLPVRDSLPVASLLDTVVAGQAGGGGRTAFTLYSRGVGASALRLQAGTLTRDVAIVVTQVPESLYAADTAGRAIVGGATGGPVPLACRAFDRNRFPIAASPAIHSATGVIAGADCAEATIARSGFDTVTVSAGALNATLPIVVAAQPLVGAPALLLVDSLPAGTFPWAPSARINSRGELEVYAALALDLNPPPPSDLHRFVSSDQVHFRYDTLVLAHDADSCALNGSGVENIAVVPRSDSTGWRMFYSSGSNDCYGWQVFSAVSSDERTWTKESGVRVGNGGPLPPVLPQTPPWPAGEGMVVDRLPSGDWRMIVGTYEHILPNENVWQITEWTSPDQLNWTYVGPVLTTRDLPFPWQGSVYSPTIREIAPGVWRMLFTADNRGSGLPLASSIWSAVSIDEEHWQVEGQLLGGAGTNLYYAALAADRLVFIRQDAGQPLRLGIATVTMP